MKNRITKCIEGSIKVKELISSPGQTYVKLAVKNKAKIHYYKLNEKRKIDQKIITELKNAGVTLKIN